MSLKKPSFISVNSQPLGQMAEVPIWHIKVDLATRFSQQPSVPTCYSLYGWHTLLSILNSLAQGQGCPFPRCPSLYNPAILVTPPATHTFLNLFPSCLLGFLFLSCFNSFPPPHMARVKSSLDSPRCLCLCLCFSFLSAINFLLHRT